MNYPIWQLDFAGGGLLIALVAIFHVFISHFAIGGGLFLVITEIKGYRANNPAIVDYVKQHTKFFLLLTLVLGAISGVGIWFTIALIAPAATSILIHNFVFGWAIEWVFFVAEIVSIMVYYYTFGKMERRNHLIIGWLYFIFAWLSLFVINGIIGAMLTPGEWVRTGNFWDGIFNPSFWPSLFFRTFLCLMLAGLYGFLTATRIKEQPLRLTMVRYCATWLLAPFLLFLASGYWYVTALPPVPKNWILNFTPELAVSLKTFIWFSPLLFLGGLIMVIRLPQTAKQSLAVVLMLIGITYMGSFEYIREGSRRPYTIYKHIYANSILASDLASVQAKGVLSSAKWVSHKEITEDNRLTAGKQLYNIMCLSCHSVGGPMRDIKTLTAKFASISAMSAKISGLGKLKECMPPSVGTPEEQEALAAYIIEGLHNKKGIIEAATIKEQPVKVPAFNPESGEYVLLAWSEKGMHTMSDADAYFSIRTPGSTINAMLILRGEAPEIMTEDVTLSYKIEKGFDTPAEEVSFWSHAASLTDQDVAPNTGISGNGLSGNMTLDEEGRTFVADKLPVLPYNTSGKYNPYPLIHLEARSASGELLAATSVVAPASTEMGCRNCHGGPWRKVMAGMDDKTAEDILTSHDKLNKTNLLAMAKSGSPLACQSCHPDPRSELKVSNLLSLSAAVHGFHANFLSDRGADACNFCHASAPEGATRFLRGIHQEAGLDCTQCHGVMEDHALSLLLAEKAAGKRGTDRLMKHLVPKGVEKKEEIIPRQAWVNEPDCLTCHEDFAPPETDTAFNVWAEGEEELYRNRADDMGIPCAACHNAPHALYPATNPYGAERDNIVPNEFQKNPYPIGANKNCAICHTVNMEDEMHHPNSLRMFRNLR